MSKKQVVISILFLFLISICKNSYSQFSKKQGLTTESRKARKAMKHAMTYFEIKDYKEAIQYCKDAIKYDSNFVEAYLLAGQMYQEQRKLPLSMYYYKKASKVNPSFYPKVFFILATYELESGKYQQALNDYRNYLKQPNMDKRFKQAINQGVDKAYYGIDMMKNPVEFNPINLGPSINTSNDEYVNSVSTDEATIVFTRKLFKRGSGGGRGREEEDFFKSTKNRENNWNKARRMSSNFNTNGNEGAMSIAPDQSELVFTACYREDGFGRCDIYYSKKVGKSWTVPNNVGSQVNTGTWESNACLSSDGKTLFYVSNRAGGSGNSDICTEERQSHGRWANVKNLASVINSIGDEMTPFIHPDGKTLYFASDGHMGMGGFDLFYSKKNSKGQWTEPVNMGYPINDYKDQMGVLINSTGNMAYISSSMKGGMGGYDIYSFKLYDEARPVSVNYMKGIVYNSKTKRPIKAKFELYDLNTNELIIESESDDVMGDFLVIIPTGSLLGLNVSKNGYLFYSEQFEVEEGYSYKKPFLKNIYLKPLELNQRIVLNNVFFETSSYQLKDQSNIELNKVKQLIDRNPKIRIEISGYTDNVGKEKDNILLSEKRAKAVYDYLISIGVSVRNLIYKGYGEENPISSNETEEGRKENRRTELKVIGL
jgi:outer membrane protein OmpA-like peptidoglycan-associated protein/Tol biopolymer transport system component